jgi:hypothetical protein
MPTQAPEACPTCGAEPQERRRCPRCGEAEWILQHGAHYMQGLARSSAAATCAKSVGRLGLSSDHLYPLASVGVGVIGGDGVCGVTDYAVFGRFPLRVCWRNFTIRHAT